MMRWPLKMRGMWSFLSGAVLALIVSLMFLSSSCRIRTESASNSHHYAVFQRNCPPGNSSSVYCTPVPCIINSDRQKAVQCQRIGDDVFIPFTFIEKYFDVSGKLESNSKHGASEKYFNWQHSYAKLIYPKLPYRPDGIFMSFDNYNVEVRDRVKCISAMEGVPMSSQWSTSGHFYPIQVAQFGLSHYSKNISEEAPTRIVIANFQAEADVAVPILCATCSAVRLKKEKYMSWVLNFTAPESVSEPGVSIIAFPDTGEPYIQFSVKFRSRGSVVLRLEVQGEKRTAYELVYTCSNETIWTEENRIFYGLGPGTEWKFLVRDVYVDLVKGLSLGWKKANKKDKPRITRMRILEMVLHGEGYLDNVTLSSSAHDELFQQAAQWLVRHQDSSGGWPIAVKRKLGDAELLPGWYSAMAQGQAMSTLTRAFRHSGNVQYLAAAVRALDLFKKSAVEKGITAVFMDRYVWYEEYPTTPSSFVLNGFIYALLGLYDVSVTATGDDQKRSQDLLTDGITSLKALLPLFDTGSGSTYDLRHFTLKTVPNIARWDYHATHITQLLVMNSIHPDRMFDAFIHRWTGYMKGERAAHN